jgi:diketogulonate reductase-like aldo/keto reductase
MTALTEKTYAIVDALDGIAQELGTTISRAALAWVQGRPGVASTIIGARTEQQLLDNLGALELTLTPQMFEKLNGLSEPVLNFPAVFLAYVIQAASGGTTVNGVSAPVWPLSPEGDADRY